MRQRCSKTNISKIKYYADKGIQVCDQWRDFSTFLKDMGECPGIEMTLDRIDNNLGYQPNNCRWVTQAVQNKNRPNHQVILTFNGKTMTVTEWAKHQNVKANAIFARLRLGWTIERALTQPMKKRTIK